MAGHITGTITHKIHLSFATLTVEVRGVGDDFAVTFYGGEKPHIGCAVLAVPRPSLTGDGSVSSTCSVLNVTGHKDDIIARIFAEKVCVAHNTVCVCTGGFHIDGITRTQIAELLDAVNEWKP